MSVESAINSLISTLKTLSNSYRSSAASLVREADDALRAARTPRLGDISYEVERETVDLTRIPRPPKITGLPDLTLPEMGELQELNDLQGRFTSSLPSLTFPDFNYADLPAPPEFTESAPAVGALSLNPQAPTLVAPVVPAISRPESIQADPISGSPPNVPLPVFKEFSGDFHDEYLNGLSLVSTSLTEWSEWLNGLRAQLLPIEEQLTLRLHAALQGTEPGLPDTWETGKYQQAQQEINIERYTALIDLDDQLSSVTGLPTGSSLYRRLLVELKTLQATTQSAGKVANDRQEIEVKHLQWALNLAVRLADAALSLRAQEADWRMKGVLLALKGAEGTLDLATRVLAFKTKEIDFLVRYNKTQVQRTEDYLKIEQTKLESLKLEVASNQLKAEYNDQQARLYQLAGQWIENKIKLYNSQIAYLTVDANWQKLALQTYEANINVYQSTVQAKNSEYSALRTKIKGDQALTEAELAKIQLYEAELSGVSAEARAQAAKVQSQAAQNKMLLEAYNTQAGAMLSYLRQMDQATRLSVQALVKGFSAEVAEQEMQLRNQDLQDQETLNNAMRELQYKQTDLMTSLNQYKVTLEQLIAQGKLIDNGASTLGGIATQAFAGLNAVGAQNIVETA